MGNHNHAFQRIRFDSGQHRRILLTMGVLGVLAFVPVALRLHSLMITQYDYYAGKALKNQTRSTSVNARRGDIYDRNMTILATDKSV